MSELTFSKEEKRQIRETLNTILPDLEELWKIASVDRISRYYEKGDGPWGGRSRYLKIDKKGIKIDTGYDEFWLEKFNPIPTKVHIKEEYYIEVFEFLKKYEEIRKIIEQEIKIGLNSKEKGLEALRELNAKYQKEALIEIESTSSNNPLTIDMKEENGKKIGEIRMEHGLFRIITRGNIILVNETESKSQKTRIKK